MLYQHKKMAFRMSRRIVPQFMQPGSTLRMLSTSQNVSFDQIVEAVSQPSESTKQHFRDKYADKIKSKLAEKNVSSIDEYKKLLEKSSPTPPTPSPVPQRARAAVVKLDEILKIDKIQNEDTPTIIQIWTTFHNDKGNFVAGGISTEMFTTMRDRAKNNPHFLFPLPQNDGIALYYFQFSQGQFAFTSLIEYQTRKDAATPYLIIDMYTDLLESKGLVLFRGQVDDKYLSVEEGRLLFLMLLNFYINDQAKYNIVETFNQRPNEFSVNALLEAAEVIAPPSLH